MLYPNYKNKPGWINQQKWLNSVQFPYGKLFTSQSVKTRPSLLEAETTNAFLMACCNKVRVGTSTTQPLDYTCWIYRTVYSRFVPPSNTNKSLVLSCTNTPVNCIPHHRFWYSFFSFFRTIQCKCLFSIKQGNCKKISTGVLLNHSYISMMQCLS